MSADLSDPEINGAYGQITGGQPVNWLLLSYGQTRDKLSLFECGTGGIEEMQQKLSEVTDIFFGFAREERSFILVNYLPEGISGVRRARALVHSRAVASLFKAHHAVLSASKPEDVTITTIRTKLKLPARSQPSTPLNSPTPPPPLPEKSRSPLPASPVANLRPLSPPVATPNQRQMPVPHPAAAPAPGPAQPTPLTMPVPHPAQAPSPTQASPARNFPSPVVPSKGNGHALSPTYSNGSLRSGLPVRSPSEVGTPQKANSGLGVDRRAATEMGGSPTLLVPQRSMGDIRPSPRSPNRKGSTDSPPPPPPGPKTAAQQQAAMSRAKWAAEDSLSPSDEYEDSPYTPIRASRSRQNSQANDAESLARKRYEQEKLKHDMDEEGRRLVEDQEYARRRAAERLAAEQRRREEAEMKRLADEKRRREEAAARMARLAEEERTRAEAEDEKKRKEEEAAAAKRAIQLKMTSAKDLKSANGPVLTGNVTVQTSSSMYWRRRYFELSTTRLTLYKSPEDRARALDTLELGSRVRAINETFEGLQAILHSFALEFSDDGPWLFYADAAVDKDLLVGALRQLTGL